MIKKVRILFLSILVLVALTSCSQDAFSGFFGMMSGNGYKDIFKIDLAASVVNEGAKAVDDATAPAKKDVADTDDEFKASEIISGEGASSVVDVDVTIDKTNKTADEVDRSSLDSSKIVAIEEDGKTIVPTLPVQTDDQKAALKQSIAPSLKGEYQADFAEAQKEPVTDSKQILAAHNTSVVINKTITELGTQINALPADSEIGAFAKKVTESFKITVSENPTRAELLNVQLAANVFNSLNNVISAIKDETSGTVNNLSDLDTSNIAGSTVIQDKLKAVVSDAAFAVNVAKAQGGSSELINSFDITALLSTLSSRSTRSTSRALSDQVEINEEVRGYISAFTPTLKYLLTNILGLQKDGGVYKVDPVKVKSAVVNYKNIYASTNAALAAIELGNFSYGNLTQDQRAALFGINGLINYSLSYILCNFDTMYAELISTEGGKTAVISSDDYPSYDKFMNAVLACFTTYLDDILETGNNTFTSTTYDPTVFDNFIKANVTLTNEEDAEALLNAMIPDIEGIIGRMISIVELNSNSDNNAIVDALNDLKTELAGNDE